MEYLSLGKIVKTQGLKGELRIYSSSDFRVDRYQKGNHVFLFNPINKERIEVIVDTFRMDGNMDIVSFKDLKDINLVSKYIGYFVEVEKNLADLNEDEYFFSDLKSCSVFDEQHHLIGYVKEVESYASYNTLRIARENAKDVLVPFILDAFILKVDIKNKEIIIKFVRGLLD